MAEEDGAKEVKWDMWQKKRIFIREVSGKYADIPPYTTHQHVNADADTPVRFVIASNRIIKALGFNWREQVEPAPDYKEVKDV